MQPARPARPFITLQDRPFITRPTVPPRPARPIQLPPLFPGPPTERKQRETKRPKVKAIKFDRVSDAKLDYLGIENTPINILRNKNRDIYRGQIEEVKDIDENYIRYVFRLVNESNENKMTQEHAVRFYNYLMKKPRVFVIELDDGSIIYRANSHKSRKFITTYLQGNTLDSDEYYQAYAANLFRSITVEDWKPLENKNENKEVKFFNYVHDTKIDLTRYQIYKNTIPNNLEHCFLHSLELCGIDNATINSIKIKHGTEGSHLVRKDYKHIAATVKRYIIIHYYAEVNRYSGLERRCNKYGDKTHPPLSLAVYKNHVFINEVSQYTHYAIKNYDDIHTFKNWNLFYTFKKIDAERCIDSLAVVRLMDTCGMFKEAKNTTNYEQEQSIDLDDMRNEQRPVKPITITQPAENIWFADTETFTHSGRHDLYLIGVASIHNEETEIFNVCRYSDESQAVTAFLRHIIPKRRATRINGGTPTDTIVYFHNLKYDYYILEKYLDISGICTKDGQIYSVKIRYCGHLIELRDSFKLIPVALAKFQGMFNLPINKQEAIAYGYYRKENDNKTINREEYRKHLQTEKDRKIFDEVQPRETFNPTAYYIEYLRLDCLVLRAGMIAMNVILLEITGNKLGAFHKLTISSLADTYMLLSGVYADTYEVTGNLRAYIGRAAVGGRVHCNSKYLKKQVSGNIDDLDATSLYPSAIKELSETRGLPYGQAYRLRGYIDWKEYNHSIMTVKILTVGKSQQIPMLYNRGESSIDWTNTPPTEPVIMDCMTLRDLIEFHKITYEILDGIYWENHEYDNKFGTLVGELFRTRLKYKTEKPALANVVKLLLNSLYGKTLLRPSHSKNVIVKKQTYKLEDGTWVVNNPANHLKYITEHFNSITSWRELSANLYLVEQGCIDVSYNRAHVGSFILSQSKHIMNRLMNVFNDLASPVYYTDTDSIHCNTLDIPAVAQEYKQRYGRELIGKQLGEFHGDFDAVGDYKNVNSRLFIGLGKKSYVDILQAEGKDIGQYHARLKGITAEGLQHAIEEEGSNEVEAVIQIFTKLAEGQARSFLLNPKLANGRKKMLLDFNKGTIRTKRLFYRTLTF
jgi:hypothetical protein